MKAFERILWQPKPRAPSKGRVLAALFFSGLSLHLSGLPRQEYGTIELLRDQWGVAHVYSETDAGAMYGLGYAHAEDRFFQMNYFLRTLQGRLSEVLGDVRRAGGKTGSLENDRRMRTLGFYRAAQEVVPHLDPESRFFLEAFSQGVNDYLEDHKGRLHYLFERTGLVPERWTPADCIALWWHCAQWFAADGLRDRIVTDFTAPPTRGRRTPAKVDDEAAVVRREDVSKEWIAGVEAFMKKKGLTPQPMKADDPPKFSHAWVLGGKRTSTGSAILVSDPQTPVWNPSFLYEFHVSGKTFNARGAGVAGSPIILIGFNPFVSWGMTALGADQADLFIYKTDPAHPDAYQYDGQWRPMKVFRETIRVKGGEPENITIKETRHGPVVTRFISRCPRGWEVAVRRVPLCETNRETLQAAIAMIRARNTREFAAALPNWRFPTANVIFGDREGNIGYWSLGAMPVRSPRSPSWGRQAQNGSSSAWDWQGMIPYRWLPHVINPKRGYLVSANHRTIQSFYRLSMGTSTGASGDTLRGLRIKERIQEHLKRQAVFTPDDVWAIQYDGVNPFKRELLRLGYFLRKAKDARLSQPALNALEYLKPWYRAGAHSLTSVKGTELTDRIRVTFRANVFPLATVYGGGGSGLARFAKTISRRARGPDAFFVTPQERDFVDTVLAETWRGMTRAFGADSNRWFDQARAERRRRTLGYFTSLEHYPSLDTNQDVPVPQLRVWDGNTIWSQRAQAYSQFVPLHDTDTAKTINPIGSSERPNSPFRFSTYSDWAKGALHPAPLARSKVDEITVGWKRLSTPPRLDSQPTSRPRRPRR